MVSLRRVIKRRGTIAAVFAAAAAIAIGGIAGLGGGDSHNRLPVDDGGVHLAAQSSSASQSGVAQPAIVGGHPATQAYPWIATVSLKQYGGESDFLNCTGSLISNNTVLTAQHCLVALSSKGFDPSLWQVRVGSADPKAGGVLANVVKGVGVPGYTDEDTATDPQGRYDDAAVLTLDRYLPNIQPLEMATSTAKTGTRVREVGYGMTNPSGTGPVASTLQELDTQVVASSQCGLPGTMSPIGVGEICVTNQNGTDGPCFGDSGGPVLAEIDGRWHVVALTIRGADTPDQVGCGSEKAIDTDVACFRKWIIAVERGEDPLAALKYLPASPAGTVHHGPGPQAQQQTSNSAQHRQAMSKREFGLAG